MREKIMKKVMRRPMSFKLFTPLFETIDEATALFCMMLQTAVMENHCHYGCPHTLVYPLWVNDVRGVIGTYRFLTKLFIALIVNVALAESLPVKHCKSSDLPDDLATALIIKPNQAQRRVLLMKRLVWGLIVYQMHLTKGLLSSEGLTSV